MGFGAIAGLFLPEELLVLLIAVAGLFMIVGLRKLASSLLIFCLLSIFLPYLLIPFIDYVPLWILWGLLAYGLVLIPFLCVRILGSLVAPAVGKHAADEMVGHLATRVTTFLLALPVLAVVGLYRLLVRFIRAL